MYLCSSCGMWHWYRRFSVSYSSCQHIVVNSNKPLLLRWIGAWLKCCPYCIFSKSNHWTNIILDFYRLCWIQLCQTPFLFWYLHLGFNQNIILSYFLCWPKDLFWHNFLFAWNLFKPKFFWSLICFDQIFWLNLLDPNIRVTPQKPKCR